MKSITKLINKYKLLIIYIFLFIIVGIGLYYSILLYILGLVDTVNETKIQIASKIELINLGFFAIIGFCLGILNFFKKINIKAGYIFLLFYVLIYILGINFLRGYY